MNLHQRDNFCRKLWIPIKRNSMYPICPMFQRCDSGRRIFQSATGYPSVWPHLSLFPPNSKWRETGWQMLHNYATSRFEEIHDSNAVSRVYPTSIILFTRESPLSVHHACCVLLKIRLKDWERSYREEK